MLFCQLAQAKSLREICGGLACCMGKLKHLGMRQGPNKSTLSYANAHRPWLTFHACAGLLTAVWDPDKRETLELLTNHLEFGATTIAAIYKDRWQIELFFKALKQNLKVKTFVGTSPNALLIQIWTALIAMLLIKYLQFRSRFGWSLSKMVACPRQNLFTYPDLWD